MRRQEQKIKEGGRRKKQFKKVNSGKVRRSWWHIQKERGNQLWKEKKERVGDTGIFRKLEINLLTERVEVSAILRKRD